jgi:radical SAM superfamily enzyme YgiQ (UPF0313 family)
MNIAYATLLPRSMDDAWRFLRPPLAAGYLTTYAKAHRGERDLHDIVDTTELDELRHLGPIAERLVRHRPDVLGLTVFVWNHVEVANVCRKVRRLAPRTRIVLGGPEVAYTPAAALRRFDADWICTGEGEIPFLTLLEALDRDPGFRASLPGMLHRDSPSSECGQAPMVANLDDIPSPYSTGILRIDDWVDLETTRGCPYRCRFCLYGKTFESLRNFSLARVESDVRYAVAHGASTIYMMDPTFNYPRERCRKICRILADVNVEQRFDVHAEVRAEIMDEALADDFVRAGVKSVEIGLQSNNKETLRLMQRGLGEAHFLKGCRLLYDRGINAEIGTIVGLPGDTRESVASTAHYVIDQTLGELNVYRLQMLPGSEYFKMADELGLVYDADPPYYIRRTPTLNNLQISRLTTGLDKVAEPANKSYKRQIKARAKKIECRETIRRSMRKIHDASRREAHPGNNDGQLTFLWQAYKRHRTGLLKALAAMPLRATSHHEAVREAVAVVRRNRHSRQQWLAGDGTASSRPLDLSWLPAAWFRLVTGSSDRSAPPARLDRRLLEVCVLSRLMAEYDGNDEAFAAAAADEPPVWDDATNMLATLHVPPTELQGSAVPPGRAPDPLPAFVS